MFRVGVLSVKDGMFLYSRCKVPCSCARYVHGSADYRLVDYVHAFSEILWLLNVKSRFAVIARCIDCVFQLNFYSRC